MARVPATRRVRAERQKGRKGISSSSLTLNASTLFLGRSYLPYGVNGLLGGAAMVFFSYVGFDAVASTAEEVGSQLPPSQANSTETQVD